MEEFASFLTSDIGLGGILSTVMLLIIFGGLVPWRQHRSALAEKDRQIEEHREDKIVQRKIIDEQASQISLLIPKIEVSVHMAETLKKLGAGEGP
ncbi:hypothetical protein [Rhodococcus rhodochrous]|uniref:hypothetical protein n=1 Tax=Rhodococcus rhodochrous TaxID=1829 RepID=UPI001E3EA2BF|nr:hypothetical protein [Rhodococcus rhodochrous]MCD2096524.1 hypothetical protein [Rhodococcus rhodochrous]MCD2121258.1 hypothetical protein [Rhodococcus rhodochrous]MCQ4137352.1 hypothetical protein [Rhodococcus rhodochrous]MDJ0021155.1 hypothetical protein [Rhodococcus rhodochrous]